MSEHSAVTKEKSGSYGPLSRPPSAVRKLLDSNRITRFTSQGVLVSTHEKVLRLINSFASLSSQVGCSSRKIDFAVGRCLPYGRSKSHVAHERWPLKLDAVESMEDPQRLLEQIDASIRQRDQYRTTTEHFLLDLSSSACRNCALIVTSLQKQMP